MSRYVNFHSFWSLTESITATPGVNNRYGCLRLKLALGCVL